MTSGIAGKIVPSPERVVSAPKRIKSDGVSLAQGMTTAARLILTCALGIYALITWMILFFGSSDVNSVAQMLGSLIAACIGVRAAFWFFDEIVPPTRRPK